MVHADSDLLSELFTLHKPRALYNYNALLPLVLYKVPEALRLRQTDWLPFPETITFINQPWVLLMPPPGELALLFCPLFALPLRLPLFAAIKTRVKFEPPG